MGFGKKKEVKPGVGLGDVGEEVAARAKKPNHGLKHVNHAKAKSEKPKTYKEEKKKDQWQNVGDEAAAKARQRNARKKACCMIQ
eukprot:CAMPEP_0184693272 /NCGR_PEP_ID=MMETSP0313-20130426/1533_1 /TAXON_ID=2792 /ORGANISM="Porphyridium aerugineum, Strain SAG 1380-2" /LENGTH=83 /DNA_ID=CAMNT_0027151305 /DNA_START=279 /DNA_END=530 /DNA_ORIENTATION=-